ncbi:MaoC family dehydratase [Mycolicibacterium sp. 624]|uniref:MaoC family dehydratase n=1 Tax=Mycolicibacterium sp. 624 TaxID=3156314 RepID=UPI0033945460
MNRPQRLRPSTIAELRELIGKPLPPTAWVTVGQENIDAFADATGDHQWIHIDPTRAANSEFKSTVAHGLYTLSLIPAMLDTIISLDGFAHTLNYGYDKVRFPAPLAVSSRFRMHAVVDSVEAVGPGSAHMLTTVRFDREGSDKPVCVAVQASRFVEGLNR